MKIYLFILIMLISTKGFSQVNKSFSFGGQTRNYIIYTPSGYNSSNQYPLVFVLHGLTQTGSGIMNYSKFNEVADSNKFIAVYPDGIGFSWNSTIGQTGTNDIGFINALLDTMIQNYSINNSRVYSCGFSNGGYMSHRIACELGNRFTAIASVSGTMMDGTYTACNPINKTPIMQIHGTADIVVSYTGGASSGKSVVDIINFWVAHNSCNTTPVVTNLPDIAMEGSTVEKNVYSNCDNSTTLELLKVINGGHTWPNATGISGIGIVNLDISASKEIWRFFNQFTLPLHINNYHQLGITVSPNPTHDYIQINGASIQQVELYSLDSKLVLKAVKQNKINIYAIPSGIYYFLATLDNGQKLREKICIMH